MSFSSYTPYQEIQFIPTPEDYGHAFDALAEDYDRQGGVAFVIGTQALRSLMQDQLYYDRQRALSTGSLFSDPFESNNQERAQAYTNGFFATEEIVALLYSGPQDLIRHQRSIDRWVKADLAVEIESDRTEQLLRRERLISFGKSGLEEIGDKATTILHRWAHEIYEDEAEEEILQEIFCLGSGALIASGVIRQRGINNALIIHETSGRSLDDDLLRLEGRS